MHSYAWEKRIPFITLSLEISAGCFSRIKPLMQIVATFLGAFDVFGGQSGLIWWENRWCARQGFGFVGPS
jgi:hypothetical protein